MTGCSRRLRVTTPPRSRGSSPAVPPSTRATARAAPLRVAAFAQAHEAMRALDAWLVRASRIPTYSSATATTS